MHRTEADGNAAGFYTEGDASLNVPATVVSASAANSWQEEIALTIEGAGLTLLTKDTDTFNQLLLAIQILIQTGGTVAPVIQTLANNSADQDVQDSGNNIEFDRTVIKRAVYDFHIRRNTDTNAKIEEGKVVVVYEPKNSTWFIEKSSFFDDAGVIFKLATGSTPDKQKLTYTTDDLTGTSYFGELSLTNYKETRV